MIVFLHIPKTGGSTFQFILENTFGPRHCHTFNVKKPVFTPDDFLFARKVFPWMQSIGGGNICDPVALRAPNAFYITFLREPVSRVFSHYVNTVTDGNTMSFEETLLSNDRFQNLQVKLTAGEANLDKAKKFLEQCHFVGLTEKFDLSLQALGRLTPQRFNLNYKRKQVSKDPTLRKKLEGDPRIVEMTREHNKLDIELYSFAVNEIFPRVCAKAGVSPEDKPDSYEIFSVGVNPRYRLCDLYNKIFRQIYKVRRLAKTRTA